MRLLPNAAGMRKVCTHSEQGDLGSKKWTMSGEHRSGVWGGGHLQKGLQGFTVQPLCSTDASPKIKPTKVQCSQIPFLQYVSSWGKWIHPKKKWNPARYNIFPCDITSTFSMPQFLFPKCHRGSSPCLSHSSAILTPLHPAWMPSASSLESWLWSGLVSSSEETVSLLPDCLPASCPWLGCVPLPVAHQLSGAFSVQAWPPLVPRQSCGRWPKCPARVCWTTIYPILPAQTPSPGIVHLFLCLRPTFSSGSHLGQSTHKEDCPPSLQRTHVLP